MRPTHFAVAVCPLVLALVGCRGRQFHPDPFVAPQQARVTGAEVVTDYSAPNAYRGSGAVTPAAGEYRSPAAPGGRGSQSPPREPRLPPREFDDGNLLGDADDSIKMLDEPRTRPANVPPSREIMDHAPDYSWIQGKLEYSALGGGTWKVRYAPLSDDDEYGGSVQLESPPAADFGPGDAVFVEGRIAQGNAAPRPLYHVRRLNRAEE